MAKLAKQLPSIILASVSPRRSELLREAGLPFEVVPPRSTELLPEHLSPGEACQINAYRKARAVAKKHPDALVIGADTVVSLGEEIFGKPTQMREARHMLTKLQGRTHLVLTGVCLIHLREHRQRTFVDSTAVTFRRLHRGQIEKYLAKVNPLDKAGAYAIQEEGDEIVKNILGSYTNVVGLPLEKLKQELERWSE